MRFLLVSDLHYALQQYDWIAAVAPEFDAVVIAGDHLDGHSSVDGGVQIVVLLKVLQRMMGRTRLFVSSGNHDLDSRDGGGERGGALDGARTRARHRDGRRQRGHARDARP